MSLRLDDSVSLASQRALGQSSAALSKTIDRVSSGLRINRAADDAAGLAIATKLQTLISSTSTASRATVDAVNLTQTADGSLSQVNSLLQRNRELAVQAANDTLTGSDRASIQSEMNQNTEEVDRIASSSSFNGHALLDGSFQAQSIQVGANSGDTMQLSLKSTSSAALAVSGLDVSSAASAQAAIGKLDTAIDAVLTQRASVGAAQNRLQGVVGQLQLSNANLAAAKSRIVDTDFASEVSNLTRNQILVQAGTAMLSQANSSPDRALQLLR